MTKYYYTLFILLFIITTVSCGKQLTSYENEKIVVDYPATWEMKNENGIINFFPKEDFGAVTISSRSGIDFPLGLTRNFILEMNEIVDQPEKVKMTTVQNVTEFYYEHEDGNLKWISKAFRKNDDFFLLTINCDLNKWNSEKNVFLDVLHSFRVK